ncbi:MAG: adenylate/guanylate cyclase domain-containing protein [Dehalococcoidia bacterium]|nr:adenylate/guanylate cyclase domain-containing protein [Dehalococcoidia bacterium]
MEPRIQYAKTSDGVSIAFATMGEGTLPAVMLPSFLPSLQMGWRIPWVRSAHERWARDRMVVEYDGRGRGLSERNVSSFTLDELVLDLATVVDHLQLERFALVALLNAGPPAIAYAVAHPERVRRLVLWNSYARGADYWEQPRQRAFRAMREADWQTFSEALSSLIFGGREFAAHIRESATHGVYKAFMDATRGFDVSDLLPQLRCPTLVLHGLAMAMTDLEISKTLATRIAGARLAVVEGDMEAVAEAIDEFLSEEDGAPQARPAAPAGLQTILFTDIEGSTAITQRLGDAKAREVLREHERITRKALKAHGGSEVKTMGDGFMAAFGSALRALECAIAIQRAFAEWNASLPAHPEALEGRAEHHAPIKVRIGLNAGEPIAEDDPDGRGDLFGTAVIRAARIAALAQGGEILVANVVRELAEGKGFMYRHVGGGLQTPASRGLKTPTYSRAASRRSSPSRCTMR